MKILLANDDGIHARGIQTLVESLCQEHEVYVVAPDRERSATGHALTLHKPIRVDEVNLNMPVKAAYAITGTPSDCVKIALNALFDDEIDMVISGINHGPNLGMDVLYSGTVSAAIEGAIHDKPSVAISLYNGYDKDADFTAAAEFMRRYIGKIMSAPFPSKTIMNINVPGVSLAEMQGICVTELGTRMYKDTFERRTDPRGHVYYWLAGEIIETGDSPTADVEALRNNKISITPVHFDMTYKGIMDDVRTQLHCEPMPW